MFIPVKHRGQPHTVLLLSGVYQTPNRASLLAFERVIDLARKQKVQVLLNSHPDILQDTHELMAAIRRNPEGPNPLLYGDRADRHLQIIVECARARVAALESGQS
jgi:hypothetical protein